MDSHTSAFTHFHAFNALYIRCQVHASGMPLIHRLSLIRFYLLIILYVCISTPPTLWLHPCVRTHSSFLVVFVFVLRFSFWLLFSFTHPTFILILLLTYLPPTFVGWREIELELAGGRQFLLDVSRGQVVNFWSVLLPSSVVKSCGGQVDRVKQKELFQLSVWLLIT